MNKRGNLHHFKPAFTLIELLVVISILAMLIAILLPSLRSAREQAKRVVCQSNMRNINMSLLMYINEFDTYPVLFKSSPLSWATWSFGGWTGRDFETYCDSNAEGVFCFQTYQRPLSVYMMEPRPILPDNKGRDRRFGTADDRITELPVFKCPADKVSSQWRWVGDASATVRDMSAYDQCGSSYQMNFYWFHQALFRAKKDVETGPDYYLRLWTRAFEIGRWLWRKADEQGGASRFVTLVEDPFDWGIAQDLRLSADPDVEGEFYGEQSLGFHGQWSRHVLAFLDGHVEYLLADTRYQREAGWTVTNDEWTDTRRRPVGP